MSSLPANDLIVTGIEDLRCNRKTIPALLVAIGAPKLRSLGLEVPRNKGTVFQASPILNGGFRQSHTEPQPHRSWKLDHSAEGAEYDSQGQARSASPLV